LSGRHSFTTPVKRIGYVDELIDSLSDSGFGYYIGSQFFGCIMYADDLIMLSPSLKGLQSMFNLCDAYAKTHFNI